MITVYELLHYNELLNIAATNNLLIMKKRIELQNRLHKCKSKTKRKKLLKEYRRVKSLCLGLMYGRASVVPDKFTSGSQVIYPSNLPIQKQNAFDLEKAEKLAMACLIKEGLLKETCCRDAFTIEI